MIIRFEGDDPLYLQTYRAIRRQILEGRLAPGDRLPSSRGLAKENAISRNVVLLAYDQLVAEGYAESRVGAGTYVASPLPEALLHAPDTAPAPRAPGAGGIAPADRGIRLSRLGRRLLDYDVDWVWTEGDRGPRPRFDFRYGMATPDDASLAAWRRVLSRHVADPPLGYGNPLGEMRLREALAAHASRSRGVVCEPDQIIVVSGSQQALDLVARVLLDAGDRIVMEEPCYTGARDVFAAAGAELVPVRVDDDGLDLAAAPLAADTARLAYVTPSHQFPTGAVMPLARRLQLLEWARRTGACIIEDDYDSEYRYEGRPIEAIQALDPEGRTLYIGTLSKVLFPALRLGFLVVPSPLAHPFAAAKWLCDRHTPTLAQLALADFISEGHFDRHLRRMRTRHAARRRALIAALEVELGDAVRVHGTNAGIHVVVWLPDVSAAQTPELIRRARERDVGLYGVAGFYAMPRPNAGLLFGYGQVDEASIAVGVRRFAAVVAELKEEQRAARP